MDRAAFIAAYHAETNKIIDLDSVNKFIRTNIDNDPGFGEVPDGHNGLIIAIEELSELTKELSKALRERGDVPNILQELADVWLIVQYTKEVFLLTDEDLSRAINVKVKRNLAGLNERGVYK